MVATSEINFGEDFCSLQHIQDVIQTWDWKPVFDSDPINGFVIHVHPLVAIPLDNVDTEQGLKLF